MPKTKKVKKKNAKMYKDRLESIWKTSIKYECGYCLEEAYNSVVDDRVGYVTDEELITSSGNRLRHK